MTQRSALAAASFSALAASAVSAMVLRCRPLDDAAGGSGDPAASAPQHAPLPKVSVIIPARDEAKVIGALLEDLRRERARCAHRCGTGAVEVIVVDDESSDATAELARRAGAVVVDSGGRPDGWNPKVWALTVGAERASHDELVFLDADVRLAAGALARIVQERRAATGLLSVAPTHHAVGVLEALSAPGNTVTVAGGGRGLGRQAAGAVGSCLAMSRQDYRRIGGHGAHPATIVDDLALAANARRNGLAISMRRGGALVSMRSYPSGLASIADGWSKNLAAGMAHTRAPAALAIGAWITTLVLPLTMLARRRWLGGVLLWAAVALHTRWLTARVGRFAVVPTSIGAPASALFFTWLTVRSLVAAGTGRTVQWKGRALGPDGLETRGATR